MELVRGRGAVIAGVEVGAWFTQEEVATLFEITDRQVRKLHDLGIPTERRGREQIYPFPHALAWWISYQNRIVRREVVDRLPVELALAELEVSVLEEDLRGSRQLQTRPRNW